MSAEESIGDLDAIEAAVKRRRAAAEREATGIASRLFVGNLDWGTSEEDLRALFGRFGKVTEAVILLDRVTGKSRGFGFVVMENHRDAAKAIESLNNTELGGRTLVVNAATERRR